jgi:hypothetical protein
MAWQVRGVTSGGEPGADTDAMALMKRAAENPGATVKNNNELTT